MLLITVKKRIIFRCGSETMELAQQHEHRLQTPGEEIKLKMSENESFHAF